MRYDDSVPDAAIRRTIRDADAMVSNLQKMIRKSSVSAKNTGLEECAGLVSEMLGDAGLESDVLRLGGSSHVPPLVYAEVKSESNPNKTILFYNHYDVQPEEPLEQWKFPPFSGTRRGNKVYGRGATDDKGEIAARMHAVSSYLRETGDVPCNVKFVIEGEEEIGSEHLPRYLKAYRKKFACNGVIWEFGVCQSGRQADYRAGHERADVR